MCFFEYPLNIKHFQTGIDKLFYITAVMLSRTRLEDKDKEFWSEDKERQGFEVG